MSINPEADLQDVKVWIKLVKEGKTSRIKNFLNRIAVPYYLVHWKKTSKEWLEVLNFKKKQLLEEIQFFKELKNKGKD